MRIKKCPMCKKEFEVAVINKIKLSKIVNESNVECVPNTKYCSQNCSYLAKAQNQRIRRFQKKMKILQHYGGECCCCNEKEIRFLTLDHINGGGNEHRRKLFGSDKIKGDRFYDWVIQNNYPEGLQILCSNCNMAKRMSKNKYCPVHHPELYN